MKDLVTVYIINSNYGKYISQAIQSVLDQTYKNIEILIVDDFSSDNSKKIINKYFAPSHPKIWEKNKNTWLNSLDIARVMKQFEEAYDIFRFLGPSPIDYATIKNNMCVYPEICNLNINVMKQKGITCVGIIFNTDYHYESGSHWVCVYIDITKNIFFFFDSTGDEPQK